MILSFGADSVDPDMTDQGLQTDQGLLSASSGHITVEQNHTIQILE